MKWGKMMENLLTNVEKRRILIVETLIEKNRFVSMATLAELCACNELTLEKDMVNFSDNFLEYFYIERSKKLGFRIHLNKNKKISDFYSRILKDSIYFTFLRNIFFNPMEDIYYWQNELFISESTLVRMIKLLKDEIAEYSMTISKKPVRLVGSEERYIRYLAAFYFEQLDEAGPNEWIFKNIDKRKLVRAIRQIGNKCDYCLTDAQVLHLSYIYATTITRMEQGFHLGDGLILTPDEDVELIVLEHKAIFQEIVSFEMPSTWYKEIARTVFHPFFNWITPNERVIVEESIDSFIDNIAEKTGVSISAKSRAHFLSLLSNIYTGHKIFPGRKFFLFDSYKSLAKRCKEEYSAVTNIIIEELKLLEEKTRFPWYTEMENRVITYVFTTWKHLISILGKKHRKVKIKVCSVLGEEHTNILKEILELRFQDKLECMVFEEHVLFNKCLDSSNEFEEVDLIVTNYHLGSHLNEKQILVDNIPGESQFSLIEKEILKIEDRWREEKTKMKRLE